MISDSGDWPEGLRVERMSSSPVARQPVEPRSLADSSSDRPQGYSSIQISLNYQ